MPVNDQEVLGIVMETPFAIRTYPKSFPKSVSYFKGAFNIAYRNVRSDGSSDRHVQVAYDWFELPSFRKMQRASNKESAVYMMYYGIDDFLDDCDEEFNYKHGKNPFNTFHRLEGKRHTYAFVPDSVVGKFISKNRDIMPPLVRSSDTAQEAERAALGLASNDEPSEWREEFIIPKARKVAEWNVRRSGGTTVYVPEYEK